MKTFKLLIILLLSVSLYSIPEEGEEAVSPMDVSETFSYRWCVKLKKTDTEKLIFRSVLEIKDYMRRNVLDSVYVKDCYVNEDYVTSKYRKFNRVYRKDDINGGSYESLFIAR